MSIFIHYLETPPLRVDVLCTQSLKQCRLCFQLVNFPSRALNIKIILQLPSFRISEHRVRVSALQEIVARRHLKIVFFGRTSSGKSSAINALLGDKILPTGESETDSSMYNT